MTVYEEIIDLARRLSSEERLQLADELLAEELGFGMWRDRTDLEDVAGYVEKLRERESRAPDGRGKDAQAFLEEIKTSNE
jgi:hypothetical protein